MFLLPVTALYFQFATSQFVHQDRTRHKFTPAATRSIPPTVQLCLNIMFMKNNCRQLCCRAVMNGDIQCNQSCVFWWIFRSLFSSKLFRDASPEEREGVGILQTIQDKGGAQNQERRERHKRNGS